MFAIPTIIAAAITASALVSSSDSAKISQRLEGRWEPECLELAATMDVHGDSLYIFDYDDGFGHEGTVYRLNDKMLVLPTSNPDVENTCIFLKTENGEDVAAEWSREISGLSLSTNPVGNFELKFTVTISLDVENHRWTLAQTYFEYEIPVRDGKGSIETASVRLVSSDMDELMDKYKLLNTDISGAEQPGTRSALVTEINSMYPLLTTICPDK